MKKCKIEEENEKLDLKIKRLQRVMLYKDAIINQIFNILIFKTFPALPMRSGYPNINAMGDLLIKECKIIFNRLKELNQEDLLVKPNEDEVPRPNLENE